MADFAGRRGRRAVMRFASLGSGSEGNGTVVEVATGLATTRVLIDCGFGVRETVTRLARLGLAPSELSAILVTHEHSDHIGGVAALAARFDLPVWLTFGTLDTVAELMVDVPRVYGFDSHDVFAIGAIEVHPFPVPHDAREPVQFVVTDGTRKLGVLTDIGMTTPYVESRLSGCDALVLECNHDEAMLANGSYPYPLKQRIAGRYGHLCNDAAGELLRAIDSTRLKHVVAAHLSQQNNTPQLARSTLAAALGCTPEWIGIADQACGFAWREM